MKHHLFFYDLAHLFALPQNGGDTPDHINLIPLSEALEHVSKPFPSLLSVTDWCDTTLVSNSYIPRDGTRNNWKTKRSFPWARLRALSQLYMYSQYPYGAFFWWIACTFSETKPIKALGWEKHRGIKKDIDVGYQIQKKSMSQSTHHSQVVQLVLYPYERDRTSIT